MGGGGVWHFPDCCWRHRMCKKWRLATKNLFVCPWHFTDCSALDTERRKCSLANYYYLTPRRRYFCFYSHYLGCSQSPSQPPPGFFSFHEDEYLASEWGIPSEDSRSWADAADVRPTTATCRHLFTRHRMPNGIISQPCLPIIKFDRRWRILDSIDRGRCSAPLENTLTVPWPMNKSPLNSSKLNKIDWTKRQLNKTLFTKMAIELLLNWTKSWLNTFHFTKQYIEQMLIEQYSLT